jgi:diguanylate cyclase (GGDEF)-like protein
VNAAQRRGLRRAVMVGGSVIAAVVLVDMARSFFLLGDSGGSMARIQAAELAVVAAVAWAASRRLVRPELLALVLGTAVYAVTIARLWLLPDSATLSVAYLAILLVGSGLFLPWSTGWHAGWIGAAVIGTAAVLAARPDIAVGADGAGTLLLIVAASALVSVLGHRLWQRRLRHMLEQQFALRQLSRYARRQELHVTQLNRELNRVARRDPLTGVGNRRALDEALAGLLDQGARLRPVRFALVLFDIDHFKAYNDEHGHLAGDAALGRLGRILRDVTRGGDGAFRYGGEEFLLLLPEVDLHGALAAAERVRVAAETDRGGLPVFTVSGGVALCDPADGRDPAPLLRRADAALYLAKRAGRNRIAADELSVAMQRESLTEAG